MAVNAANLFAVECDSTVHFGKYSSGTPATLPTDLSAYVAPPGSHPGGPIASEPSPRGYCLIPMAHRKSPAAPIPRRFSRPWR